MFLHLERGIILKTRNIIGVFDLDKMTIEKKGRVYLSNKEKSGKIIYVSEKIPKSFVLCMEGGKEKIYISQMSASTLLKRSLLKKSNILSF